MPEPFLEKLSRFTPSAGTLDRDALIYAGGRASARPNRVWITMTIALAACQVLTAGLWWFERPTSVAQLPPTSVPAQTPAAPVQTPSSDSPENDPGLWSARHGLLDSQPEDPPAAAGTFVDSEPPLRAYGASLPATLN